MTTSLLSPQDVVDYLNDLVANDPNAIHALIANAVPCNKELAEHPSCQVRPLGEYYGVSMLGVISGMFGENVGTICAVFEETDSNEWNKFAGFDLTTNLSNPPEQIEV